MRDLTFWERKQAPFAARTSPAAWIPGVRAFHTASRKFELHAPLDKVPAVVAAAVDSILMDPPGYCSRMEVQPQHPDGTLTIWSFTNRGWLDIVELNLSAISNGTLVEALGWSCGFVPLSIPGASLLNIVSFWVPFSGVSSDRIDLLKDHMSAAAEKEHSSGVSD